MSGNIDDTLDRSPPRRRETIMERRLRKARGEDIDDSLDDMYDYDDDAIDDYAIPHPLNLGIGMPRPHYAQRGGGGSGCAQATLYLVLGSLATLLIMIFFVRDALSSISNPFQHVLPDLGTLVASPTPTIGVNTAAVVQRVQQLQKLETTSYTMEKVIEAGIQGNVFENILFGDRLLLIAHGTVVAGIDLSKLREEDVVWDPAARTLTIRLPPVEIFSVNLDNTRTRVYDRQQGLLAPTNKDLETQARQSAEQQILEAACEGEIMVQAHRDSQEIIRQLLHLIDINQDIEMVVEPAAIPPCVATVEPSLP